MKILLLAPHPFYQERGTPIAVNLLLQALSGLGHAVDILTYHEGADVIHSGVTIHRIRRPLAVSNVPPGPSLKKILCDLVMFPKAISMARHGQYDLIHAVEESVYMAKLIRRLYGIPYLYDMDSSLALQVAEKFPLLKFMLPVMRGAERSAIRSALAVVPVCDALADIARAEGSRKTLLLRDISLLKPSSLEDSQAVRQMLPQDKRPCFMYIGNLESYQGVDLMLESFSLYMKKGGSERLVVAGGKDPDILRYRAMADAMGLSGDVLFLGPQPVSRMAALFDAADVLISPRVKGNNTPMKIYSYLASGKAILATALPTHTQVLTPDVAMLVPPEAGSFAGAMAKLANDDQLRLQLGSRSRELAQRCYSEDAFQRTVADLYAWTQQTLPKTAP